MNYKAIQETRNEALRVTTPENMAKMDAKNKFLRNLPLVESTLTSPARAQEIRRLLTVALNIDDYEDSRGFRAFDKLAKMKAKEAIPILVEYLSANSWLVRENSAETLGKLKATHLIPALHKKLKEKLESKAEWSELQGLVFALGELKAKEALPEIWQCLKNGNSWLKRAAVKAVGKMHEASLTPFLMLFVLDNDEDSDLREESKEVLKQFSLKEFLAEFDSAPAPIFRQLIAVFLNDFQSTFVKKSKQAELCSFFHGRLKIERDP
ncbi:MAG: HEAT repeat domain-containing protein, partial [Candidatus Micrarchaeota archaeon]